MAYGRLDVYWPDGPIENYHLEKPSVAIGRSTGNDIVLDTNAVSRYHLSISYLDGQVYLQDLESANGTYIDGQRIKSQESIQLRGGEEIQVGDIRIVFLPQQEDNLASTRPIFHEQNIEETQRFQVTATNFRADVLPPEPVTPGAYMQAVLELFNDDSSPKHVTIAVKGVPEDWVRIERTDLVVAAERENTILISFKPLRRSESAPGSYPVIVQVTEEGGGVIELPFTLTVRSFSGFGMVLGSSHVESGTPAEVHVQNQGNAPLPLIFSGAAPQGGLLFDIQPPQVTLKPGETRTLRVGIRPTRPSMFGAAREHEFDIQARAQDASGFLAALRGTVVERPLIALPVWIPLMVIALVFVVAGGIGLFGLSLVANTPRPPLITSLRVSDTSVAEGESVTISWAIAEATSATIQLDNNPVVPVDPKQGSITQIMTGSGDHRFVIVARNDRGAEAQQDVGVAVSQVLRINALTVTPNPLLRNIRQNITLTWNIEGAQSVRFLGIEALTGKPDDTPQPGAGQLVFTGTPRDTLELKIIATSAGGSILEQTLRVEIKKPTCRINAERANVYGGPGANYAVKQTLNVGTEIAPDGRDQSGQWLHLAPSPDPQMWVQAAQATCEGFAADALTAITSIPPTPPPTATPLLPTSTPVPPTDAPTQEAVPNAAPTAEPTIAPTVEPTAAPTAASG